MITIGIDLGTTTISGAVLESRDSGRRLLHAEAVPNDSFLPPNVPGARIQDAAHIIRLARELLDRLLSFCEAGNCGMPEAIGLTGQMHGIVYADDAGRPLSPLYTWQDLRGEEVRERIFRRTGLSVPAGYGLATHLYNHIHGLVPEGAVSLCTVMDLFAMHLTGNRRPLMHMTNAASLGFFDLVQGRFREDALKAAFSVSDTAPFRDSITAAKIPSDHSDQRVLIPEVEKNLRVIGNYRGIPVTIAIGDNQAGFLASVGTALNTPLVNFGTGGQVSMLSDQYSEIPGIETRPFLPGLFLMAGSSLCGGRAYAILEQFFRSYAAEAGAPEAPQYELMNRLAEEALQKESSTGRPENSTPASPDSVPPLTFSPISVSSISVSPLFCGTREDPSVRGSVTGISEDNFTPGALILGTLRGMTEELYGYYEKMASRPRESAEGSSAPEPPAAPARLIGSGNGLRKNPVLQKLVSERFGAPLELSPFEEEAACGAAVSAGMALATA